MISFFVLRKSNPRKAIYCLIIGGIIAIIVVIGNTLFNAHIIILPNTEYWQGISQYIEKYGFGSFFSGVMITFATMVGIGFALYNFLIKKIKYKPIVYGVGIVIPVLLWVFYEYVKQLT